MAFLRRMFGGGPSRPEPVLTLTITTSSEGRYGDDELAVVAVGNAEVPASIWRNYQREAQDWTSRVRLEDPETGEWLRRTDAFPDPFQAAGARAVAVAGVRHHPDASRDEFGVGRTVRLVPEPTNPVDPNAIAVRSADGRYLAGYIPADDLDEIRSADPPCTVGLVVWENFTWRPRERLGLRLLVGPSIRLALVPPNQRAREAARREAVFEVGKAEREARLEQEWAEREARKRQVAEWREQGRCADCGAALEPGKKFVRCASCRGTQRTARQASPSPVPDTRTYANTDCPYCGVALDPLPKAKKGCPSCGQPIYVRSGPDGFTYLLQEADLHVLEEAWAEHLEARDRAEFETRRAGSVANLARTLRDLRDLGLRVEILTDEQSCAECRKFRGHVFDPRAAPVLPYVRCRNEFCRCDYLPVIE